MVDARLNIATGGDLSGIRNATRAIQDCSDELDSLGHDGWLAAAALEAAVDAGRDARPAARALLEAADSAGQLSDEARQAVRQIRNVADAMDGVGRRAALVRRIRIHVEETRDRASQFGSDLGSAFSGGLPPQAKAALIAGLAGTAAAASPAIIAMLNGAIITGIAGGGLAAGIALAAKDPRVAAAWTRLGKDIKADLQLDASSAMAAPLVNAAGQARSAWSRVRPVIAGVFESLAPSIGPLVRGLGSMFDQMGPGLDKFAVVGRQVLDVFAGELPELGRSVGDFFDSLASGGEGAQRGIALLVDVISFSIAGLGQVIETFSKTFDLMFQGAANVADAVGASGVADDIRDWGLAGDEAADGFDKMRAGAETAAPPVQVLTQYQKSLGKSIDENVKELGSFAAALKATIGPTASVKDATIAAEAAYDGLTDSVKENGKTLDITTPKGRANTEALKAGITAAQGAATAAYDLAVEQGRSGDAASDARAAYNSTLGPLLEQARKLGLNKDQVNSLITAYGGLPGDVSTKYSAPGVVPSTGDVHGLDRALAGLPSSESTAVSAPGASGAAEAVRILRDRVASLPSQKTVQIITRNIDYREHRSGERGDPQPRASGGPVTAGMPYIVGDGGVPELFVPKVNGMILPRVPGAAGGGSFGGGTVINVTINLPAGADGRHVVEAIKKYEKRNGASWRTAPA